MNDFIYNLSSFAFDKKILKNYLFVIVHLESKDKIRSRVRINAFYKNGFSMSWLSEKETLSDILIEIGLGDREVREIVKTVNCVYLSEFMIKE